MLKFYGDEPPCALRKLRVGGRCPGCGDRTRWTLAAHPIPGVLRADRASALIASYLCDGCLEPIGVRFQIPGWADPNDPKVDDPESLARATEPFDLDHVPESVAAEIKEALGCLQVHAYNGFAAVVRRAVQALCTDLGADSSTKVQKQIDEMAAISGLDEHMVELAKQVMLTGHDGSHPHLPTVDETRAGLLLALLGDLTYQLYTRPGNVQASAALRTAAIKKANS